MINMRALQTTSAVLPFRFGPWGAYAVFDLADAMISTDQFEHEGITGVGQAVCMEWGGSHVKMASAGPLNTPSETTCTNPYYLFP